MEKILCGREYASPILAILNEAIATSTALYDYHPRTPAMMEAWFDAKAKGSFPVIGFIDGSGALMAFGSYGTFRAWPAYKYTVEHSLYVERSHRGKGLGKAMLDALIEAAAAQGCHNMIAGIDAANEASLALHRGRGFLPCGTIRHAGFKFGKWIDLQFHQLLLEGPENPLDG